ncbi:AAA family ATPase [Methylobacterium sp. WL12]|uniref:AAA family ATPase n=1 Tax=Methylobacterium sp. WL12 TaxID=2603890 RepID=UPI0011C9B3E4|nr:AAA family ATPase [Methylobacterium sp. WL12]TXM65883.1 AAA family ATPase [Methylobacterium sp. WL12]
MENVEFAPFEPDHADAAAGASDARATIRATPYRWRDPASIPPREWLYSRHLIRRFLSTTVAPGAVGKSSLVLVEAIAMATGRPLLGVTPPGRLRVWYVALEDPLEEIERRGAAICLRYGIEKAELEGRLFLDSGRTSEIVIATTTKDGAKVAEPVVEGLVATITANQIDVVTVDPFVSSHRVSENDNAAIDLVAKAWNRIAETGRAAIELVHHVRKGQGGGAEFTVEDGRGAGALLAAARSARVLNPMSKDQAERANLASHRGYFRADNGKANLAPPPDRSEWFKLASVELGNGPGGGDHVAVVEPWQWPDLLEGVTVDDLRKAQRAVAAGRWRENAQAKDWAGIAIAEALGIELDVAGKARVKAMLRTWIGTGMFVVVEAMDSMRRPRSFVEVGEAASD